MLLAKNSISSIEITIFMLIDTENDAEIIKINKIFKHCIIYLLSIHNLYSLGLRGPGGLHQNSLEIDFIVVSDRGE